MPLRLCVNIPGNFMNETKPHCKCLLNCAHHRNNAGGCDQPATNWDGDHLCEDCRDEKIKYLRNELAEVNKDIRKWEAAHALMLKTGQSGEKDVEKKTLDDLNAKRDEIARELEQSE